MKKIKVIDGIHQLTAVKADIIPGLADCPWPIADSHCSPCTIHPDNPNESQLGFHIWGEYNGDASRKQFHAQSSCVDGKVKRLVCRVARMRSTPVPENDGLFIGFVDLDTLNDPNKLYDPNTWAWAGYLADLPGGTPTEHYYICVDIEQDFDPSKEWYLLISTNGSYEICGWQMSGFGASDFPDGVQPLWKYNLNEPGKPDGWQQMDNYYRGCVIPYCEGGGAIIKPDTSIETPVFPGTAQEGVPYEFSFTQINPNAFPCGCPATFWTDILDRDTGNPIGDKAISTLPCGYTGLNWTGTINFAGSFTFHGQLRVGHYIAGDYIVDDTYDFDVVVTGYPCSHWTNSTDCEAHNCWWWNSSCHDNQPTQCSQLNNQSDCEHWGCYWYDGSCHSEPPPPPPCSSYTNQSTCEAHYCWWWNGACHDDQPTECIQLNNKSDCERWGCAWWNNSCHGYGPSSCEELNNQTDCELYKCYWYNNSCHSSPQQPEICDWIDSKGGPNVLTPTHVVEIINSYLFDTPPPDAGKWTFVPTVLQATGVVDYYLGFDADAKTGCDYF